MPVFQPTACLTWRQSPFLSRDFFAKRPRARPDNPRFGGRSCLRATRSRLTTNRDPVSSRTKRPGPAPCPRPREPPAVTSGSAGEKQSRTWPHQATYLSLFPARLWAPRQLCSQAPAKIRAPDCLKRLQSRTISIYKELQTIRIKQFPPVAPRPNFRGRIGRKRARETA